MVIDSITDTMYTNLSKLWETLKDMEAWRVIVHEVTKSHDLVTKLQEDSFLRGEL